MNCNEKGSVGLIKVIDDLQDKGFFTFIPFDGHSPIDLIAVDSCGRCIRLQVKYKSPIPSRPQKRYSIPTQSIVNGKRVDIDRAMIDGWALYLSDLEKVVYVSVDTLNNKKDISIDPYKQYWNLEVC